MIAANQSNWDQELAARIDHTLLRPEATATAIARLCAEAARYRFAAVCINPYWVPLATAELVTTGVAVCTVIGFPLGASLPVAKAREAEAALVAGARELDMVLNVGALKSGRPGEVEADIRAVVTAAGSQATVKVILETALLTDDEKVTACLLSESAGAHYVKTSTGFGPGGATLADVALLRRTVGPRMGVKAAGGIRDLATARAMLSAGADRLGTSAGVALVTGQSPDRP